MQNAQAIPISAATDPSKTNSQASTPDKRGPGRRLGRTALAIHMLAWFAFGSAWALMLILGVGSAESRAIQGVGGAMALTCAAWSGLLALRAIWQGERVWVPILILVALGIEAVLPCAWLWLPLLASVNPMTPLFEFSLFLGLPLFVPYFVIVTFIAVPLSWFAVRLLERWKRKPDDEPWSRRQRLKRGFVIYVITFAISLVTVFPYPLFAYCALEQSHRRYWQPPFKWQAGVLRLTPNYVRTGLDDFCSTYLSWRFVRHRVSLIEKGHLPPERLLVHMGDPWEEIQASAWKTYFREHTEKAIALSESYEATAGGLGFERTWGLWHSRLSFRDWPIQQRIRWIELLQRALSHEDYRVRRAAARVTQACLSGPDDVSVPWPWNTEQPPEQENEQATVDTIRGAAAAWIAKQEARLLSREPN